MTTERDDVGLAAARSDQQRSGVARQDAQQEEGNDRDSDERRNELDHPAQEEQQEGHRTHSRVRIAERQAVTARNRAYFTTTSSSRQFEVGSTSKPSTLLR